MKIQLENDETVTEKKRENNKIQKKTKLKTYVFNSFWIEITSICTERWQRWGHGVTEGNEWKNTILSFGWTGGWIGKLKGQRWKAEDENMDSSGVSRETIFSEAALTRSTQSDRRWSVKQKDVYG